MRIPRSLQVNEGMMRAIERDVELYEAARQPTPAQLRAVMMRRQLRHALPDVERSSRLAALESRLAADPYDVEAQRELEELIAQRNIEDNREMAMEVRRCPCAGMLSASAPYSLSPVFPCSPRSLTPTHARSTCQKRSPGGCPLHSQPAWLGWWCGREEVPVRCARSTCAVRLPACPSR